MIVEQIPDVLSSPKDSDDFFFDKNGRFVYIVRYMTGENPTFLVCDVMFNATIKFIADASISNLLVSKSIWGFLPINTEQILLLFQTEHVPSLFLLLLIGFDTLQKSYKILDQADISNHRHAELVCDDNAFGVFFVRSKISDSTDVQAGTANYAFRPFEIHANQIRLGAYITDINYTPCKWMCTPRNLYLRHNKLWYVRTKDEGYPVAAHYPQGPPSPVESEEDDYWQLSYFDLSKNEPTEVRVAKVQKPSRAEWASIIWVQECFLLQKNANTFNLFELSTCAWSPETFDCSVDVYSAATADAGEWFTFPRSSTYTMDNASSSVHIDEQFVVNAVNKKTGYLHRIRLRRPHKLINIAWFCALNAGLLETALEGNLPYSRVF